MIRILLCGCSGHMGRAITELVSLRDDCEIVAGVDRTSPPNQEFPVYSSLQEVQEEVHVLIDFSHPSLLSSILEYGRAGIPLVLCTTGYTPEQVAQLKEASALTPIFYSRNMSLGINLLIELCKKAAAVLGPQFDIEITEKHHNQKLDAPSGTALMLADGICSVRKDLDEYMYDRHSQRKKRSTKEIGLHAVRGGTIVGEHEVLFAGRHECISLSHSAQSKELFANGTVNAAVFMKDKPAGLYDMSAML